MAPVPSLRRRVAHPDRLPDERTSANSKRLEKEFDLNEELIRSQGSRLLLRPEEPYLFRLELDVLAKVVEADTEPAARMTPF